MGATENKIATVNSLLIIATFAWIFVSRTTSLTGQLTRPPHLTPANKAIASDHDLRCCRSSDLGVSLGILPAVSLSFPYTFDTFPVPAWLRPRDQSVDKSCSSESGLPRS